MGNNNTRESRPPGATESADSYRAGDGRSRHRASRGDASFLGLSTPGQRDRRQNVPFEHRETKQEREARRLERERATRIKDRERSLREEHVDGGYLVTLGTYTGTEDFSKPTVRQLQVNIFLQSPWPLLFRRKLTWWDRLNEDWHLFGVVLMTGPKIGQSISWLLLPEVSPYLQQTNLRHRS